jgi:hypothetical protein
MYIYIRMYRYIYIYVYVHNITLSFWASVDPSLSGHLGYPKTGSQTSPEYDNDDVNLKLKNSKGFYNLLYMIYVKHINPASKA